MCALEPQFRQHLNALTVIHQKALPGNKKSGMYHHMKQSIMIWLL